MKNIEGKIEEDYAWIKFKKNGCTHKVRVNYMGNTKNNYLYRVRTEKFNRKGVLMYNENRKEEYSDYDVVEVLESEASIKLTKKQLKQLKS